MAPIRAASSSQSARRELRPEIAIGQCRFAGGPECSQQFSAYVAQHIVFGQAHEPRPEHGAERPFAKRNAALELALGEPRRRFQRERLA